MTEGEKSTRGLMRDKSSEVTLLHVHVGGGGRILISNIASLLDIRTNRQTDRRDPRLMHSHRNLVT